MTNDDHTGDIYGAHDDNDDPGENAPLLIRPDSPSSIEAQGPPHQAESKYHVFTHPRFSLAVLASILILLAGACTLAIVVTKNSCSVQLDQSETIANLTTRLDATKASLEVCTRNSTTLGIDLDIERVRLAVCRDNGRRLAERVDKAEGDLELCTNQKLVLEGELEDIKSKEEACKTENVKLRRQVEDGAFIEFREFINSLGTGGDSWVCSETTQSWHYGYVSKRTPHPVITIKTWKAELNDAEHSTTPLVFPPSASQDHPSPPGLLVQHTDDPRHATLTAEAASIYIIGYSVISKNVSGGNGWWRITNVDRFGIKDGRMEFWALAAKWIGSRALYDVQVWYTER